MTTQTTEEATVETRTPPVPGTMARAPRSRARDATARRVTIEDLNAWYGSNHAVRGLDLEFAPNEVTAIIGPSGCGKSTMVRCLNRMHEEVPGARASGAVKLDHVDVYDPSVDVVSVRRTIGSIRSPSATEPFQPANPLPPAPDSTSTM